MLILFCGRESDIKINLTIEPYKGLEKAEEYLYDDTEFSLSFRGKIWTFKCEDFKSDFKQFDINYEFNKFNLNNNKNQKIILINKLKKLNIENKLIIEYLFPNFLKKIEKISKNIEKQAKNAEIIINNKINIINEKYGIKINFDEFFNIFLNNYLIKNKFEIEIPVEIIKPEITSEELKKSANLRSTFSTNFSTSSKDRKHNISQASKKINGIKLAPNEKFSFNKTVGRRTKENGFRVAKIISQGEFIDGVGGGVCQVSTTLYNAVLKAGLKVDVANKHSEKISYVTTGFDAMVNYGSSDFVFTNNTAHDIYIFSSARDNALTIKIFGEALDNVSYKLKNEIIDKVSPEKEKVVIDYNGEYIDKVKYTDESFYLKRAKTGFVVKSYREKYLGDKLVFTELIRTDKYKEQQAVKVVGALIRSVDE